jgi:hypothetical protein
MQRPSKPFRKGIGIIKRNKSCFPAGVFHDMGGCPVHMPPVKRGKGPYLYDYDENRYVDFDLSRGSLLLGHAPAVLCSTVKSWLGRGYASGYPVVSHEILSGGMREALKCGGKGGSWLFYNSPFEAGGAAAYLLKRYWKRESGLRLSSPGLLMRLSPFSGINQQLLITEEIDDSSFRNSDFVVLRVGRSRETGRIEDLVRRIKGEGLIVASDETDFGGHIYMSHYTDITNMLDMRVFGSFLSSGLPFGCVYIGESLMERISAPKDYVTFIDIASLSYSVPLYTMKTVIRYLKELQKQGGVERVLQKAELFYSMLDGSAFELAGGLVYLKEAPGLKEGYRKLRLRLLDKGFYFPLHAGDPIAVSLAHSDELLKKSAGEVNALLKKYIQ